MSTRRYCSSFVLVLVLGLSAFAPGARAADDGDDRYRLIAGLCERGLTRQAIDEARSFLRELAGHRRASLVRYRLAGALYDSGRKDEARPLYAELGGSPGFEYAAEALFRLGELELERGDAAAARAALEAVLRSGQAYLAKPALLLLGEAALSAKDHAAAHARYAEVLARQPSSEEERDARRGLLWCAFETGDWPRACADADAWLSRHASDASAAEVRRLACEAALAHARALLAAGDASAALSAFEDAERRAREVDDEARTRATSGRGDALAKLGRRAEAERAWEAAGSEYALVQAAIARLNDGDPQGAAELARRFLEQHAGSDLASRAELVLAEALFALGSHAEAEPIFARLAGQASVASRALLRAGWCRYLAKDPASAARRFQELVERHSDAPEAEEGWAMLARSRAEAGDTAGASAAWQRYVERHPSGARHAETALALGLALPGEAGERILRELAGAADGNGAAALSELASRAERAGRAEEARAHRRVLLERHPAARQAPRARDDLAFERAQAGAQAEAAELLAPLLASRYLDPGLAPAVFELAAWNAAARADESGCAQALQALSRSGAPAADLAAATVRCARVLAQGGQARAAQALIDTALGWVREGAPAVTLLVEAAWSALDAGQLDRAEAALRVAERAGGTAAQLAEASYHVGAAQLEQGAVERSMALLQRASQPGSPLAAQALYRLGFAHLQRSENEAAERAFSALVEREPKHELFGETLFLLGEARFRLGDWPGACAALARLRKELPQHAVIPKALFRHGLALERAGQAREATQALGELARRFPDFPNLAEAELARGRALVACSDARGARAAFERTISLDKGELGARARLELGRSSEAQGDLEGALAQYLKVALLYAHAESVAQALVRAGALLERSGDVDQARARYREVLERHAKTPSAQEARERLAALDRSTRR
jgi:TolA-binding protein